MLHSCLDVDIVLGSSRLSCLVYSEAGGQSSGVVERGWSDGEACSGVVVGHRTDPGDRKSVV